MGRRKAVFDINIPVNYLNGTGQAADELQRLRKRLISQITRMEVPVGCRESEEERLLRELLDSFDGVRLEGEIAKAAVMLRRENGLKLPDAAILATAECRQALLVTWDAKVFPAGNPGTRIPYRL